MQNSESFGESLCNYDYQHFSDGFTACKSLSIIICEFFTEQPFAIVIFPFGLCNQSIEWAKLGRV